MLAKVILGAFFTVVIAKVIDKLEEVYEESHPKTDEPQVVATITDEEVPDKVEPTKQVLFQQDND